MSDPLRERIAAMRAAALDHLEHDPAVSGGIGPSEAWTCLGLVADCTRVLAALHPDGEEAGPATGRAVVSDDGETIRLTLYTTPDDPPVGVALPVPDAVRLAAELSGAASRHMACPWPEQGAAQVQARLDRRNHRAGVRRDI